MISLFETLFDSFLIVVRGKTNDIFLNPGTKLDKMGMACKKMNLANLAYSDPMMTFLPVKLKKATVEFYAPSDS